MLTWYVHPSNLSIIYSQPARFVITEMYSDTQRIVTITDSVNHVTTQCVSVVDAMRLADATYRS